MERGIFVVFFTILFINSSAFAETILLKSGKTIEGKIVEKSKDYIKAEVVEGIPLTYFLDEIESINGKPISIIKPSVKGSTAQVPPVQNLVQNAESTLNESYNSFDIFKIRLPRGWQVSQKVYGNITQVTVKQADPLIGFVISYAFSYYKSPDIFKENISKALENENRSFLEKKGLITDKPFIKTTFQNMPALRFDIDIPDQDLRLSKICFIENGHAFTIIISRTISQFDLYDSLIIASINTFELITTNYKTQGQMGQQDNKTVSSLFNNFIKGMSDARIKANEETAHHFCKVYADTLQFYKKKNQRYPSNFKQLNDEGYLSPSDPHNRLILSSKPAQGYYYSYNYIDENHFVLQVEPANKGVTGNNTFRIDESGELKVIYNPTP